MNVVAKRIPTPNSQNPHSIHEGDSVTDWAPFEDEASISSGPRIEE